MACAEHRRIPAHLRRHAQTHAVLAPVMLDADSTADLCAVCSDAGRASDAADVLHLARTRSLKYVGLRRYAAVAAAFVAQLLDRSLSLSLSLALSVQGRRGSAACVTAISTRGVVSCATVAVTRRGDADADDR